MRTQEQLKQGQELLQKLIRKAWDNPEFKSQLVDNPKKTISVMVGNNNTSVQDGKEIVVEDQTDESVIYLNIPPQPNLDEFELTEEELEMVSGGSAWACAIVPIVLGALYDGIFGGDSGGGTNYNIQIGSGNSNNQS